MGMVENSRGRRERSPKQEYLKQVLVLCGGEVGLYRRGGASDSTNLDAVIVFDECNYW